MPTVVVGILTWVGKISCLVELSMEKVFRTRLSVYQFLAAVNVSLTWILVTVCSLPACGEQDKVVTTSVWCMCIVHACMHLSGLVQAITCTCMHGFQINLAQLFSLRSRRAIWNICYVRLKVKVILAISLPTLATCPGDQTICISVPFCCKYLTDCWILVTVCSLLSPLAMRKT